MVKYIKPPVSFWDEFSFKDFQENYYTKYDVFNDIEVKFVKPKVEETIFREYEREELNEAFIKIYKDITKCKKCKQFGLNEVNEKNPKYSTMAGYPYGIPSKVIYFAFGQSLHGYNPRNVYFQIPFKGPFPKRDSGILLYNSFNLAGIIERENLMVSNVVKCHPPGNRPSFKAEIENCSDFLKEEITLIEPLVMIPIGNDAWKFIHEFFYWDLVDKSFKRVFNGKYTSLFMRKPETIDYEYFPLFIIKLVHPSFIQRRGNKKEDKMQYMKEMIISNKLIVEKFKNEFLPLFPSYEKYVIKNIKNLKVPIYKPI